MSTPLEFLTCYILVQISANNQRDISRVSSLVVTCNMSKTSVMSTPLVKSTSLNNSGDSPGCQRTKSSFQRRASQVKFGCHLATPAQVSRRIIFNGNFFLRYVIFFILFLSFDE